MEETQENSGLGLMLAVGILAGLAMMIGPWLIPTFANSARMGVAGFGLLVFVVSTAFAGIAKLYVRTKPDEAFVRTGMNGQRVVIDGGTMVVPVFHQIKRIPLRTLKLEVERKGTEALITSDFLRVDIRAAFFVRVAKDVESIQTAASTLPDAYVGSHAIQDLVQEKLVSALRTVAAQQTLNDLNTRRNEFAAKVQEMVTHDLAANGLTLESVTISNLDQAPLESLRPDQNVFDAQGARTISQMVSEESVRRNEIERTAQRQKKEQDVSAAKYIAEREVEEANARAEADKNKQIAMASSQRSAAEAIAQADSERKIAESKARQSAESTEADEYRKSEVAKAASSQAIQVAEVEKAKAIELANQEREKVSQIAAVEREKEVAVREQERGSAIANAEQARANAETEKLNAENARETAAQEVQTTRVVAEAERRKRQEIIQIETDAERLKLERAAQSDADAYAIAKNADAEQQAAAKMAEAMILKARAEKQSKELTAEGDQAIQMVPVAVERERVTIERQRVEVMLAELEAKAAHASVSVQLEIAKAMIEADRDAKIAAAQAMGQAFASANMTIWGDPESVKRMSESFLKGQQFGALVDGVSNNLPDSVRGLMESAMGRLGAMAMPTKEAEMPVSEEMPAGE